jgi:hypothetical protein
MPAQRYGATLAFFADPYKSEGYGETMRGALARSVLDRLTPYFAAGDLVEGANRADIPTYLPDDLMVKVDVASMAHGLETRSPLLDHVLLEWAARIPAEIKMKGGTTKALFKAAMAPYLPREILRRKKMGFGVPLERWFRRELRELAYDTLLGQAARERGIMRPVWREYARRLWFFLCHLGQFAQIHRETRRRTGTTEGAPDFVIATASRNCFRPVARVSRENDAAVIMITTQFRQIEAELLHVTVKLPPDSCKCVEARCQFRIGWQALARKSQHFRTAIEFRQQQQCFAGLRVQPN